MDIIGDVDKPCECVCKPQHIIGCVVCCHIYVILQSITTYSGLRLFCFQFRLDDWMFCAAKIFCDHVSGAQLHTCRSEVTVVPSGSTSSFSNFTGAALTPNLACLGSALYF